MKPLPKVLAELVAFQVWKGCEEEAADRDIRARAVATHRKLACNAGIPERLRDLLPSSDLVASQGEYVETPDVKRCLQELCSGAQMLLLMGKPGTGKTVAAARCALESLWKYCGVEPAGTHHSYGVHWISAYDYCRIADWDEKRTARYRNAPFLVLDELGQEGLNARRKIEALVCARYESTSVTEQYDGSRRKRRVVTIFTTNLTPAEFGDENQRGYHARIRDRILQTGKKIVFKARMRGERK